MTTTTVPTVNGLIPSGTVVNYNLGDGDLLFAAQTYDAVGVNGYNGTTNQYKIPLIQFGPGIQQSDLSFYQNLNWNQDLIDGESRACGDLIIKVNGAGSITIQDYFRPQYEYGINDNSPIFPTEFDAYLYGPPPSDLTSRGIAKNYMLIPDDFLPFTNNVSSGLNDVLTATSTAPSLWGKAGDDTLLGYAGYDTLVGGIGNDLLEGGTVNNTYLFWAGSGNDTITTSTVGWNQIIFQPGVNTSDIVLSCNQNDLLISYDSNPADQITVKAGSWINRIQTPDGSYITGNGINLLMQEMSAYATAHNEPLASIADAKADPNLLAMITAAWHH